MPDLLDRLKTALADRYAIEHELGSGGMATVYLAEDLKPGRPDFKKGETLQRFTNASGPLNTPRISGSDGRTATQMAWPSCGCLTDAAKHRKVLGKMTSMTFVEICTCCCPGACHNADRAEYCML